MAKQLLYAFMVIQIYLINAYQVSISPSLARVIEGGSIRLALKTQPPMSFSTCKVKTSSGKVITNNNVPRKMVHILDEMHTDGMQWLSLGECGLILVGASTFSEGIWEITGQINNNEYTFNTRVNIIALPSTHSQQSSTLGFHTDIDCNAPSPTRPTYCRIINNNGELVSDTCTLRIDPVKIEHVGNWTCKIGVIGAMEEITHVIELSLKPRDTVIGYFTKTESSIILQCTLEDSNLAISWCRATGPFGKQMMLTEGLIADKYSAFGTDITKKQCGIEIRLPLDPNLDIGRWRIDLGRSVDDFTGCFFTLPDNEQTNIPIPVIAEKEIFVLPRASMQLKCSVPWPIRYCYAKGPNGEMMHTLGGSAERLHRVGFCQINIQNVSEAWSGKWACAVSSPNDVSDDVLFYTNVHVLTSLIVPEETRIRSFLGKTAILTCKSPTKQPMRYCRFISPSGRGFSVHPDSQTNSKYVYWGKGLDHGECGMQIKIISREDEGIWTCATSFISGLVTEDVNIMHVSGPEPGVGMIIGMSIGGIMLGTTIIVLLIVRFERRKKEEPINQEHPGYQSTDDNLSL